MNKKKYLFKTLSRTKRKDDENFVINAIWNRANNLELKPVTQQYVNCNDAWYLIDLFFPQINLGVEVDEQGHMKKIEQDQIRSDQIVSALKYDQMEDFKMMRVKTHSNDFQDLINEIDQVVNTIRSKVDNLESTLHWETREEVIDNIRNRARITIYDDVAFHTIREAINELFDWGRKPSGGATISYFRYKHNPNLQMWFAHRNIFKDGKEIAQKGWINRLSRDGKQILEFDVRNESIFNVETPLNEEDLSDDKRITFLKYRNNLGENGYKFVGVFQRNGSIITEFNGEKVKARKYDRIQDYMNLPFD